ncbi:MAG TPA: alpha/beta hydrolase [Acetobacteraceae bacterium]|nr:alpha/beta hydrolase [Acetobacteraceae bacterium]
MSVFPDPVAWRATCAADPVLAVWVGDWAFAFAVADGTYETRFAFAAGAPVVAPVAAAAPPQAILRAPAQAWAQFLQPVPPRHHHNFFAMLARVPGTRVDGDLLAFYRHAHVVRRVLEIGRWLACGNATPAPVSAHPAGSPPPLPPATGGYVPVTAQGVSHAIYFEQSGTGPDILCLHTAGADGRQFHGLMADSRLTDRHRLVAFDLPWHGRSPPPPGAVPGSWRLDTELYVALIMGFVASARLRRPIVLGASMSGEICLELALRYPDAFAGIIACEACEKVEGRFTAWPSHPEIHQGYFIPEWIHGLAAPQSPAECVAAIDWHYAQGGPGVFTGDLAFYAGDWDARARVHRIDGHRARLYMLTGTYDYSCTTEMSAATAAKIPGATFREMPGIGHFPFAENPELFAGYLIPILNELETRRNVDPHP